ncbi:MAG: 5-nucleotidase protein [Marmoricola sp.]|nr:5-nucleotidase protein [Marmoricola sp.]
MSVSQVQAGSNDQITATWTPNDSATTYRAFITDAADGTSGSVLAFQDVPATSPSTTATISTAGLAGGQTYWVAVKATAPSDGTVVTSQFTAITLDTTGPAGTFTVDHTLRYLAPDFASLSFGLTADVHISQSALADDTTAPAAITRQVNAGDGSGLKPWTSGTSYKVTYTKAGTFTPHVVLTDQFGNVTDKVLSTVTIAHDTTAPTNHITTPTSPSRIASWRVIRGKATDSGTGVQAAAVRLVEKRGTIWYAYDFAHKKWLRGWASMTRTLNRTKAEPAFLHVTAAGAWRTPFIRGLTRGTLHVEALAIDGVFNVGQAPKITRPIH